MGGGLNICKSPIHAVFRQTSWKSYRELPRHRIFWLKVPWVLKSRAQAYMHALRAVLADTHVTRPVTETCPSATAGTSMSSGIPAAHRLSLFLFFLKPSIQATPVPPLDLPQQHPTGCRAHFHSRCIILLSLTALSHPKPFPGKEPLVLQDSAQVPSPPGNLP